MTESMLARFRECYRWFFRIGWVYTGTQYERDECGRISHVQLWLNVHSCRIRRVSILQWYVR